MMLSAWSCIVTIVHVSISISPSIASTPFSVDLNIHDSTFHRQPPTTSSCADFGLPILIRCNSSKLQPKQTMVVYSPVRFQGQVGKLSITDKRLAFQPNKDQTNTKSWELAALGKPAENNKDGKIARLRIGLLDKDEEEEQFIIFSFKTRETLLAVKSGILQSRAKIANKKVGRKGADTMTETSERWDDSMLSTSISASQWDEGHRPTKGQRRPTTNGSTVSKTSKEKSSTSAKSRPSEPIEESRRPKNDSARVGALPVEDPPQKEAMAKNDKDVFNIGVHKPKKGPAGIGLKDGQGFVLVSKVNTDSIFHGTALAPGQRILSIQGVSVLDKDKKEICDIILSTSGKLELVTTNAPMVAPSKEPIAKNGNDVFNIVVHKNKKGPAGIGLKDGAGSVIVTKVNADSVFHGTALAPGQCILLIQDVSTHNKDKKEICDIILSTTGKLKLVTTNAPFTAPKSEATTKNGETVFNITVHKPKQGPAGIGLKDGGGCVIVTKVNADSVFHGTALAPGHSILCIQGTSAINKNKKEICDIILSTSGKLELVTSNTPFVASQPVPQDTSNEAYELAMQAMLCAVIGIVLFRIILGGCAICLANQALSKIREDKTGNKKGKSLAQCARVLGSIEVAFSLVIYTLAVAVALITPRE